MIFILILIKKAKCLLNQDQYKMRNGCFSVSISSEQIEKKRPKQ